MPRRDAMALAVAHSRAASRPANSPPSQGPRTLRPRQRQRAVCGGLEPLDGARNDQRRRLLARGARVARLTFSALGDGPARSELERLRKLLPSQGGESSAGDALRAALESYNRRLAQEIRAGRFDGVDRAEMLGHLRRTTEEKLAVSNPKALK